MHACFNISHETTPHGDRSARSFLMATLYLPLPAPSNFNLATPNQWAKWKQRFELFRKATGLSEAEEARQVSTLLYCLGEDAASILTNISAEDAKIYSKVLDKLDSIFEMRKNTL